MATIKIPAPTHPNKKKNDTIKYHIYIPAYVTHAYQTLDVHIKDEKILLLFFFDIILLKNVHAIPLA